MMRYFLIYSYDNYDGGHIITELRDFGSAEEVGSFLAEWGIPVKSYTVIKGQVVTRSPIE